MCIGDVQCFANILLVCFAALFHRSVLQTRACFTYGRRREFFH